MGIRILVLGLAGALASMGACKSGNTVSQVRPPPETSEPSESTSPGIEGNLGLFAETSTDARPEGTDNLTADEAACGGQPLSVTFYDSGQALAALVTLPDGRHILVDTGESPRRPGCGTACTDWNRRVLDGLERDLAGAPIDLIWITHQHSDHHGGLPTFPASGELQVHAFVDNGTQASKRGVKAARDAAVALSLIHI